MTTTATTPDRESEALAATYEFILSVARRNREQAAALANAERESQGNEHDDEAADSVA